MGEGEGGAISWLRYFRKNKISKIPVHKDRINRRTDRDRQTDRGREGGREGGRERGGEGETERGGGVSWLRYFRIYIYKVRTGLPSTPPPHPLSPKEKKSSEENRILSWNED